MFLFSSRRRHTRFDCDWSSDVCSSDLSAAGKSAKPGASGTVAGASASHKKNSLMILNMIRAGLTLSTRSEERRVGKECRCEMAADPEIEERLLHHGTVRE